MKSVVLLSVALTFFSPVPSRAAPTPAIPKCFGVVIVSSSPWTLLCQNPCFPSGCGKVMVTCGDGSTAEQCDCRGPGFDPCCDIAEHVEGDGVCAVGDCGGTCPEGECGLVGAGEDVYAQCETGE